MHPAYSVIVFTTASGAGYGLLFWLAVAELAGDLRHTHWSFVAALAVALALVTAGLLSSTLHLGRPERAWRALSQWRSSWLSREGVAALATYVPAGLLGLLALLKRDTGTEPALAALAALGAIVTVWCTGMIYASLRTIRQWNLRLVPLVYLALAAASGAVLFGLVLSPFGAAPRWTAPAALAALAVAAVLKVVYFARIDARPGAYTAAMAFGLGEARIRPLDPPHTRPNFVMREMGYAVARRHAARLRRIALGTLFVLPGALVLAILVTGALAPVLYLCATLSMAAGLAVERWLFFAEAEHLSMLYYGAARA